MLRSIFPCAVAYTPCTGQPYTRVNWKLARANASWRASRAGSQQPSLSRGWILQPKYDSGESRVEVLLSSVEEVEDGKEQELPDSLKSERMQVEGKMKLVPEAKYVRGADINKASFIRVYYISALRVPAKDSCYLAQRLEEHLLNWPRVDNIARVAGDDVDEDLEDLFSGTEEWRQSNVQAITHAVYGEDAATNSEAMRTSDVIRQEDRSLNGTYDTRKRTALKYQPYTLEVLHDETQAERRRGTLEFLRKKWAGATRLLLLKEELVGKSPQLLASVQAVLEGTEERQGKSRCELVSCRLTLFYEYWSSEEVLRDLLPPEVMVPDAFERFGHVAFLTLSAEQLKFRHLIAQVTLDKYQPVVRSVVLKRESRHTKSYAVRVEVLAGTSSLVTTVSENGIPFRIDLGSVLLTPDTQSMNILQSFFPRGCSVQVLRSPYNYCTLPANMIFYYGDYIPRSWFYRNWDSRVKADRQRLIELFSKSDVVCDVFSGPGAVAIPAGVKVRRTFANEANPVAYNYLARNVVANKLTSKVEIFNLDTRHFLDNLFDPERPLPITQVVMTYPSATAEFLDFFVGAFDRRTWELASLPRVHLYRFSSAADPAEHFAQEVENFLGLRPKDMDVLRVAEVAPGEWMLRASFTIPSQAGFKQNVPLHA